MTILTGIVTTSASSVSTCLVFQAASLAASSKIGYASRSSFQLLGPASTATILPLSSVLTSIGTINVPSALVSKASVE